MQTITVCSSANFYRQAVKIQAELEKLGYKANIPVMAERMKEANDYDVSHFKTWFGDPNDYHKKTAFMRGHFKEVEEADAILILNYEKHGVLNYIGGNVLMEMAIAFNLKKPIFILNEIPSDSPFFEELKGLGAIELHGKVPELANKFKVIS